MADRNTKFEDLSTKEKIEHIWTYYKFWIIGAIAVIWLICYLIYKFIHPDPDTIMNAVLVNADYTEAVEENAFMRYLDENGYNREEETIAVNDGLWINLEATMGKREDNYSETLAVLLMGGGIDVLAGPEDIFALVGESGAMEDVRTLLSSELAAKYQDRFFMVVSEDTGEEMPCAIWLEADNPLAQDGYYAGEILVGIPNTTRNKELAIDVLLYLLGE